jgi:hypothetical protein
MFLPRHPGFTPWMPAPEDLQPAIQRLDPLQEIFACCPAPWMVKAHAKQPHRIKDKPLKRG